ncbi:MAG: extracellular solute-binding protein [Anaerolineae bacterium]|nr:extracellular solute-binding protein [Anaerolineae bacterium]
MSAKRIAVALVLILATVLANAPAALSQGEKSIRFATYNSEFVNAVNDMLVQNFNKLHPDVKVNVEYIATNPAIEQQFASQAAAKNLADVVFLADLYVVPFAKGNIVADMEPLAKADKSFDLSDIYPNMLDLSRVNGKGLYMIPSSFDVVTAYYNKTMWEKAGAKLPTANWTWDDYITACVAIRKATGNYCFAGGMAKEPFWWAWYVPFIKGYGGDVLSADGKKVLLSTPESLAGLQAYVDLWTKYDIAQPLDFDAGGNCFVVGKCASLFHIPALMGTVRALNPQPYEWDLEVIPSHPKGKFTGMGTYGFAVSANAKDPQLAWDFVKGLVSKDMQLAIAKNYAGTPLLKSLREDPAITKLAAPPAHPTKFIENGQYGITPPYFPGDCGSLYAGQINQEISDAFEAAVNKTMSVKDAFTAANDHIQACLDKTAGK